MPQKVLINVHGNLPEDSRPVVGNGLRARQLGEALQTHGVTVQYAALASFYSDVPAPDGLRTFRDAAGFRELLRAESFDLAVFIQGEGLEYLPEKGADTPVLADWIAPRTLEFAYQNLPLEQWLPRLTANVRKADYHACCTDAQRGYLYFLLQLAGVSLASDNVLVIPLSARTDFADRMPQPDGPVFVAGGVHWPWIQSDRFLRIMLEEMDRAGKGCLQLFGGEYPFRTDSTRYRSLAEQLPASPRLRVQGMMPYPALIREYLRADVAVNLFEENPERQMAFSFREIDYLKAGLPLVCSGFSHVARYIRQYGAGWILEDAADESVRRLFREILGLPRIPSEPGAAAREIIRRHFDQSLTIAPLLQVLAAPRKQRAESGLLHASFLWAEHARAELERSGAELRALREELAGKNQTVDEYRQLDQRNREHLVAAEATVAELRSYVARKEQDMEACMRSFSEKDEAQGYQKARLLAAEGEIASLKADLERVLLDSARQRQELDRLQKEKAELEAALHNIQSKFLYRLYKKVTGK
jgi:hypothetical protein